VVEFFGFFGDELNFFGLRAVNMAAHGLRWSPTWGRRMSTAAQGELSGRRRGVASCCHGVE
jgi:hypothetical protein